ncbi:MAG: DNA polymerase [Aquihabitans sp.]
MTTDGRIGLAIDGPSGGGSRMVTADEVAELDRTIRPRWVLWSQDHAGRLVAKGVRLTTCWDVVAVHRLLRGGWSAEPGRIWAASHDLDVDTVPRPGPGNLFDQPAADDPDPSGPVRPDGHLRPDWADGGWSATDDTVLRWACLALEVARRQEALLTESTAPRRFRSTAHAESTAELLCAELTVDGLPFDRTAAVALLEPLIGRRPRNEADAAEQRARRDADVLRHLPPGVHFDLRSPGQVKSLLRFVGIEVPDTRAWRLEAIRDAHPVVEALLAWRKAERMATTYGYSWLDTHVGEDGRLRGVWSASDGAAGRMTASAGLHNLPADMRVAVRAAPGHRFVRADLGQIEPRVLASVSGDAALARATLDDDLYLPVAQQIGVDRPTAKVAVLGAMYGQTTGHGAQVLPRLRSTYPVAMAYLDDGDRAGQAGRDLRTYGGRLVHTSNGPAPAGDQEARSRAAAQGRFGRNALVQGAAAELFKVWALTVRARGIHLGARIVLCLHDELLVHVPTERSDAAALMVADALQEAAHRWAPDGAVRFVADLSVIDCWADAKD